MATKKKEQTKRRYKTEEVQAALEVVRKANRGKLTADAVVAAADADASNGLPLANP
jgi:hypothetical protein